MNVLIGKLAAMAFLTGLAGCNSATRVDRGPMDMLEDRGVVDVSTPLPSALPPLVGRDVKIAGIAVPGKAGSTYVKTDGWVWRVQIRTLNEWPADIVGRTVRVKGVLQTRRQTLDIAGNPINDAGDIVQGYSGVSTVYYLADCVYERD